MIIKEISTKEKWSIIIEVLFNKVTFKVAGDIDIPIILKTHSDYIGKISFEDYLTIQKCNLMKDMIKDLQDKLREAWQ